MAAKFVDSEIVPHVREWDRREEVDRLGYALVVEELGRGESSVRGIVSVSLGLVAKSIATHGTEEQKQRWLPLLTSGDGLGCFALTEPDAGSDPASLTTRAQRD